MNLLNYIEYQLDMGCRRKFGFAYRLRSTHCNAMSNCYNDYMVNNNKKTCLPAADSLAMRIHDAGARVLVTADAVYRGTKRIKLLEIAAAAMEKVTLTLSPSLTYSLFV